MRKLIWRSLGMSHGAATTRGNCVTNKICSLWNIMWNDTFSTKQRFSFNKLLISLDFISGFARAADSEIDKYLSLDRYQNRPFLICHFQGCSILTKKKWNFGWISHLMDLKSMLILWFNRNSASGYSFSFLLRIAFTSMRIEKLLFWFELRGPLNQV